MKIGDTYPNGGGYSIGYESSLYFLWAGQREGMEGKAVDLSKHRPCTDKGCEGVVRFKVTMLAEGRVKLVETCTTCHATRERFFNSAHELGRYFVQGK
jgi:hypothetical protein